MNWSLTVIPRTHQGGWTRRSLLEISHTRFGVIDNKLVFQMNFCWGMVSILTKCTHFGAIMCVSTSVSQRIWFYTTSLPGPVSWGSYRIHQLHLCSGVKKTKKQWLSWIWHKAIRWWGSSNAEALGKAEYSFIAIAPRSTLARSGYT